VKTGVARDSKGQIMWIKGRTDLSPLTYREWREGMDMQSGRIVKEEHVFYPPFELSEEDIKEKP